MITTKTLLAAALASCLATGTAGAAMDPVQLRGCVTGEPSAESLAACDRLLAGGELTTAQTIEVAGARATARLAMGETEQAIAEADALVARFPGHPRAEAGRAVLLMFARRPEQAEASARRAIDLDGSIAAPYFVVSTVLEDRGDSAGSLTYAAMAAARAPRSDRIQNDYCWKLAVANRELEKALAACNRAVELAPHGDHYDSRGFVHWRRGDAAASVADYDAALAMRDTAYSRYGRGLARQSLGDAEGAKADFDAAVKLDPDVARTFAAWGATQTPAPAPAPAPTPTPTPVPASALAAAETEYAKARFSHGIEVQLYTRRVAEFDGDAETNLALEQQEAEIEALARRADEARKRVVALGGNPDTVPRWLPPPAPTVPNLSGVAAPPKAPTVAAPPDNRRGIAAAKANHDVAVRDLATAHEDLRRTRASGVHLPDVIAQLQEEVAEMEAALREAKANLALAQSPAARSPAALQGAQAELQRQLAALQVAQRAYDETDNADEAQDDRLWQRVKEQQREVDRSRRRLEALGG